MSRIPLAKYEQAVIAGERHSVPPGWGQLFATQLAITGEKLGSIERNQYQVASAHPPIHGEFWVCGAGEGTNPFQVTSGYLQVFVLTGSLTVTKTGTRMYVKAGEKINFQPGDIFSLESAAPTTMAVRSESCQLMPAAHPKKEPLTVTLSKDVVNLVRAQLGLPVENRQGGRSHHAEDRSSAGYRGRPKYGSSGSY